MLEQSFRRNFLQHSMAVSMWMQEHQAKGGIDPRSLSMEIALGGNAVRFYPQFAVVREGGETFIPRLEPGVRGFVGWMPYFGKGWKEAGSKLAFKRFAARYALPTPAWGFADARPPGDHLVKESSGTLGRGIRGPFRASQALALAEGEYWEHFMRGRVVKAWYWDGELAVVEVVPMPTVTGDGKRMVAELALEALGSVAAEHPIVPELLALQELTLTIVPAQGQTVQLEYRYISPFSPAKYVDHNVRDKLRGTSLETQLVHAGRVCLNVVPEDIRPCTAFTLDGVLDAQGQLWLLEMNSNPQLHPAFYRPMLDALFVREAQLA
jgi:hypothetical protein